MRLTALLLTLLCSPAHAAVFTLQDVVLARVVPFADATTGAPSYMLGAWFALTGHFSIAENTVPRSTEITEYHFDVTRLGTGESYLAIDSATRPADCGAYCGASLWSSDTTSALIHQGDSTFFFQFGLMRDQPASGGTFVLNNQSQHPDDFAFFNDDADDESTVWPVYSGSVSAGTSPAPEPSTWLAMIAGLLLIGYVKRGA